MFGHLSNLHISPVFTECGGPFPMLRICKMMSCRQHGSLRQVRSAMLSYCCSLR